MKNTIILAFGLALCCSSLARAERTWQPACGFADDTLNYIRTVAGEPKSGMVSCRPLQGESDRRMFFYPNGDWVVIYAYYTTSSIDQDIICVVDSGSREDAEKALEWTNRTVIKQLPAKWLSPKKPKSDVPPPPSIEV